KLRVLPIVKGTEGAYPLITVQHRWQIRFVTGRAKFGGVVDVLHHRFGVAIGVGEDFGIGHQARDSISLFIDHNRWNSHDETAVAEPGFRALDGMAGGAGETVAIEGAVHGRVVAERAGQNANRIMATVAVAGK